MIEWFWSGLSHFRDVELGLGHWKRSHCRSWAGFFKSGEPLKVLSREPTGAKWCFRKMILALRCSQEPPPKKALQWWGSRKHSVQRSRLPSRLADLLGPLLLPYMAIDYHSGMGLPRFWPAPCHVPKSVFPSVLTVPILCTHPNLYRILSSPRFHAIP